MLRARKWVLFSFWECFKTNVIAIAIVITFNVIVIDYILILFIRNHNRACGKYVILIDYICDVIAPRLVVAA